ncbi:MAG: carbohydrate kinase [Clostridiales bacterium]|nr:carbohydrate kinase [Clostridiales bacterium]
MANRYPGALIGIGEALIDMIPDKSGVAFSEIENFAPRTGGAPANVCAAFAKLGGSSLMLTQLGDDLFGKKIASDLEGAGVDTSHILFTDEANTALAFVSLEPDGNRSFSFYRNPSADMLYREESVPAEVFKGAFALHFCSVSLGDFPMKEAHIRAIEYARTNGVIVSFDPNLRFMLWDDRDALQKTVNEFIPRCDILKISDEELEFITGRSSIDDALPALFDSGVRLVLYTCGAEGAYAYTKSASGYAPALKVNAVDTTGAGDAFIGAFLRRLQSLGVTTDTLGDLSSEELSETLRFSCAYSGMSVTSTGAIPSYPSASEMADAGYEV